MQESLEEMRGFVLTNKPLTIVVKNGHLIFRCIRLYVSSDLVPTHARTI